MPSGEQGWVEKHEGREVLRGSEKRKQPRYTVLSAAAWAPTFGCPKDSWAS